MSSDEEDSFLFEEDEESILAVGVVGSVAINSGYVAVTVDKPGGGFEDMIDPSFSDDSSSSVAPVKEANASKESNESEEEPESPLVRRESSKLDRSSEDTPGSPGMMGESGSNQVGLEELLRSPMSTSSPKQEMRSSRRSRKSGKRRKRKAKLHHEDFASGLPVLNKDTENKLTYDIEYLLESQKQVHAKHRFVAKCKTPVPEPASEPFDKDYIKQNIVEIDPPKITFHTQSVSVDRILPKKIIQKHYQPADFVGRLYRYRDQVEEKLKHTKEQLMQQEKEVCTFVPAITTKSASTSKERRHPEDLYYAGVTKAHENVLKIAQMKLDMRASPSTFRPSLNQKSLKILEKKGRDSKPVYAKLYSAPKAAVTRKIRDTVLPRSRSVDRTSDLTFRPSINKKSEKLSRDKQINEMLYEDAKRRAQRPVPRLEPFQQKLISKNSEKVLISKFETEFRSAWGKSFLSGEPISIEKLEKCLELLHFHPTTGLEKPTKLIWDALQAESRSGIKPDHCLALLKVIMRFPSKPAPDKSDSRFGYFNGENFVCSAKDVCRIHIAFQSLYEARLAVVNKSNTHPQYRSVERLSFRPDISLTSPTPKSRSRRVSICTNPEVVEKRLLAETQRKQEKIEKVKEAVEKEKMSECTFSPAIKKAKMHRERSFSEANGNPSPPHSTAQDRNLALYRLATVVRARRDVRITQELAKIKAEAELQKHDFDCPFTPSVDLTE